jgi:uncharacterized membrane protein YfcA
MSSRGSRHGQQLACQSTHRSYTNKVHGPLLASVPLPAAAPDWPTGIALGLGGLAGGYTGARLQSRLPDVVIRRLVGVLVLGIGICYLWSGLPC